MVTLKDLANELNVSVSTVSKALSDSHEISKETKQKILALAKKRNYTPNSIAINLKRKETKAIGVIIPNIFNHFYTKILSGIESEAKRNGYKTIVSISNEKIESEKEGLTYFSNGSVDGVLLALSEETEKSKEVDHILKLQNKNIPFVLFDRYFDSLQSDRVIIDDYNSAKNAIHFLKNSGRKKLLVVSLLKNLYIGSIRKDGALSTDENIHLLELDSEDMFESELKKILKEKKIDAILALDELSGIISLNLTRTMGYSIPDDISIISFSQGILSKYSYPKLTTINQHADEIGKKSLQLLLKRLKNKDKQIEEQVIKTTLDLFETT
jgi:LacI family transcriptional regulator